MVSLHHGLKATLPDAGCSESVYVQRKKTGIDKGTRPVCGNSAVHAGASGQLPDARGCSLLQCFMPLSANKSMFWLRDRALNHSIPPQESHHAMRYVSD